MEECVVSDKSSLLVESSHVVIAWRQATHTWRERGNITAGWQKQLLCVCALSSGKQQHHFAYITSLGSTNTSYVNTETDNGVSNTLREELKELAVGLESFQTDENRTLISIILTWRVPPLQDTGCNNWANR
ncbi:hypothetical protein J6590_091556 [Homalodisca vitripennis]|nr:hypothetical protein J6590_091556 [Homalodisca vitripennis]